MKNKIIKWLGGVTREEYRLKIDQIESVQNVWIKETYKIQEELTFNNGTLPKERGVKETLSALLNHLKLRPYESYRKEPAEVQEFLNVREVKLEKFK